MATKSESNTDEIQKWLQKVEDHLTSEGLGFVKLCFYYDIEFDYDSIDSPSKLFIHLLDHCFNGNEIKTFEAFVNALKDIGTELRGTYLVQDCMPSFYHCFSSKPHVRELNNKGLFCLCLVRIGTKLRGLNIENKMITHFCRPKYLNINNSKVDNLPMLFVRLIRKNLIQWNNTAILVEWFSKCGANVCLRYLNNYYCKVKLQQLQQTPYISGEETEDSPPQLEELKYTSSAPSTDARNSLFKRHQSHRSVHLSHMINRKVQNQREHNIGLTDSEESDSESSSSTDPLIEHSEEVDPEVSIAQPSQRRRRGCCVVGSVCIFIVCSALFAVMFPTVWMHLIVSQPTQVEALEGSTIVIEEINQFFVHNIDVYERDFSEYQAVEIYEYNGDCSHLPTHSHQQKIGHFVNLTNIYLLKGTVVDYKLILPTMPSNKESVEIYLISGLISDFNPHILHPDDIKCNDIVMFDGSVGQCSHKVIRDGYFNLYFLLPKTLKFASYDLSVTFLNSSILITEMNHKCTITEEEGCYVAYNFSNSVVCLVGNVVYNNSDDPFVTLYKDVKFSLAPVLGITVSICAVCILVAFLVFCVVVNRIK